MRVFWNLFDYGDTGVLGLSSASSAYGSVPAAGFGGAVLWKDGASTDLLELCTRPVDLAAQREAIARLRRLLAAAIERVHKQLDWAEARHSESFRELPSYAMQMGGSLLLLGFVGAISPPAWRLVDLRQQRMLWESDSTMPAIASRNPLAKLVRSRFPDSQLPRASGVDYAEIQIGMTRALFVLDNEELALAEWSLDDSIHGDNYGLRSGMLSQPDRKQNVYSLVDVRSGKVSKFFPAPTHSKSWSRPATTPGSDRIAISHKGGTVDIVDGFGEAHFSIRPFPQYSRTEDLRVRLSDDGAWLGAYAWRAFRVVDLTRREVAEISVPPQNLQDDPERVLYNYDMLATRHGIASMDETGFSMIPYSELRWQPVTVPGGRRKGSATVYKRLLGDWRKPALALAPAKSGRSWLYGTPDLPTDEVPVHDGSPMRLLARIDLGEASALRPGNPWPKQGALYFFTAVDSEGLPLQDDMFNLNATTVIWRKEPALIELESDEIIAEKQPLAPTAHEADLPDIGAAIVEIAMLGDAELEAYRAWLEKAGLLDQPPGHRFGGYPTILQHNDLEAQAAHFAEDAHYPPRSLTERSAASRWRLLLQLDSDEACMWGTDSGMLYFLIHDDDLARQDFSRVVSLCEGR
jgi:uncharacterized protein YwqG